MRKLLIIALLMFSLPINAWEQRKPLPQTSCVVHAPWGFPQTVGITPICREAYFVGYDAIAKIPKYVTYQLTPQHALGCVTRSNGFVADNSVSKGATPGDYVATEYDRGHQAPDGDMEWSQQTEYESFLMTNMAPQAGSLNRGIWKLLESSIRAWSSELGLTLIVHVGAVYNNRDKQIGKGVTVPHGFYKIVVNQKTGQYAAWLFPHVDPYPNLGNDLTKFRVSIDRIQNEAGIKFSLPLNAKLLDVGKEWPVDYGKLTKTKKANCSIKQ